VVSVSSSARRRRASAPASRIAPEPTSAPPPVAGRTGAWVDSSPTGRPRGCSSSSLGVSSARGERRSAGSSSARRSKGNSSSSSTLRSVTSPARPRLTCGSLRAISREKEARSSTSVGSSGERTGPAWSTITLSSDSVPSALSTTSTMRLCWGWSMWAAVEISQNPPVRPCGSGKGVTRLTWLWPLMNATTLGKRCSSCSSSSSWTRCSSGAPNQSGKGLSMLNMLWWANSTTSWSPWSVAISLPSAA
jgi:hypothetical protein